MSLHSQNVVTNLNTTMGPNLGVATIITKKKVGQTMVVDPNKVLVVAMDIESRLGVPPIGTTCFDLITFDQIGDMEEVGITFANVNDYGRQIC